MQEGMLNVAVESLVHSLETAIRCQCIAKGFLGQEHPCRDQIIFSFEAFCYFLTSQLEWSEYWWVVPSGKLYLKWTLEISVSGAVLDEDIPRLRSEPRMLKLAAKAKPLRIGISSFQEMSGKLYHSVPKSSSPVTCMACFTPQQNPASGVFVRPKYFSSKLQVVAFTNKVRVAKPETKKTSRWLEMDIKEEGIQFFPTEVGSCQIDLECLWNQQLSGS